MTVVAQALCFATKLALILSPSLTHATNLVYLQVHTDLAAQSCPSLDITWQHMPLLQLSFLWLPGCLVQVDQVLAGGFVVRDLEVGPSASLLSTSIGQASCYCVLQPLIAHVPQAGLCCLLR